MIKHAFTCPISDGGDTNQIQPSDWNTPHVLEVLTTDPVAPAVGELWMLATGTSPDRLLELKFRDTDGSVVVLFTVAR